MHEARGPSQGRGATATIPLPDKARSLLAGNDFMNKQYESALVNYEASLEAWTKASGVDDIEFFEVISCTEHL